MNESIGPGRRSVARAGAVGASTLSALAVAALLLSASCAPSDDGIGREETAVDSAALASADVMLSEVAGAQFERLEMAQRWRAVASLGTGLPPSNVSRSDLPEPDATGAGLLEVYCTQCHWLPTPQMHSADEWDILLRRMLLRARLLQDRLEGEHVPENLTVSGRYRLVPTPEHRDSLRVYLRRNALPVADPEALPQTAAAEAFVEHCSSCHQTPSPEAHVASEWEAVVERMQANTRLMEVDTLSPSERDRVLSFLEEHAAGDG